MTRAALSATVRDTYLDLARESAGKAVGYLFLALRELTQGQACHVETLLRTGEIHADYALECAGKARS